MAKLMDFAGERYFEMAGLEKREREREDSFMHAGLLRNAKEKFTSCHIFSDLFTAEFEMKSCTGTALDARARRVFSFILFFFFCIHTCKPRKVLKMSVLKSQQIVFLPFCSLFFHSSIHFG